MRKAKWTVSFLLCFLVGCANGGDNPDQKSVISQIVEIKKMDWSTTKTIGDYSYIPLALNQDSNSYGNTNEQNYLTCFNILEEFKKIHPEWRIVNWRVMIRARSAGGSAIQALIVDHEVIKE